MTFGVYSHRTYAGESLLPRILSSDFNLSMEKASYVAIESTYKLYVYRHAKELVRAEIARRAAMKVEKPVEVAHEEPSKNNTTTPPAEIEAIYRKAGRWWSRFSTVRPPSGSSYDYDDRYIY